MPEFIAYHSIIVLLGSYIIGSIPFGIIISKLSGIEDLRSKGSGNIGATNAWRVGGKKIGIITFLCDWAKGFLVVYIFYKVLNLNYALLSAFFVIIGHIFPIWLKFKGGKGIATMLGAITVLTPELVVIAAIIWITVFKKFRYSSLASLSTIAVITIGSLFYQSIAIFAFYSCICCLIFYTHKKNIISLLNSNENKM